MAAGNLGKSVVSIGTYTKVYEVPSTVAFATIGISIVNNGVVDSRVKIAISNNDNPNVEDFIENTILKSEGGILERTGMMVSPGEKILITCDAGIIVSRVYGIEQSA